MFSAMVFAKSSVSCEEEESVGKDRKKERVGNRI